MRKLVFAALLTVAMASPAAAGNISVSFTGGPGVTAHFGGTSLDTQAGDFLVTVNDNAGLGSLQVGQQFLAFCVDLQHFVTSPVNATLDSLSNWTSGAGVGNNLPPTFPTGTNTEGKERAASLVIQYASLFPLGATNPIAAAYQIAIWEVLYESSNVFDTTAGAAFFTNIDGSVLTNANNLIAGTTLGNDAGWLKTFNSDGTHSQDFSAVVPTPDGGATLALLGGALMALGAARRRFAR